MFAFAANGRDVVEEEDEERDPRMEADLGVTGESVECEFADHAVIPCPFDQHGG